jgi:hypothetical protein
MTDRHPPSPRQQGLFEGARQHRRHGLLRRLGAAVAPLATDAGAVIDDERQLEISRRIARTLQDQDSADGLSRSQILERAAAPDVSREEMEARFDVLVKLEMLQPVLDKRHQDRYVLNPAGLAGLLMVERAASRGGIDEVLMLLSRTRDDVDRSLLTVADVSERLRTIRGVLAVMTSHLERLIRTAPLDELIDARRQQDIRVVKEVQTLCDLVSARFPLLESQATYAVEAALTYLTAVESTVDRFLSEGGQRQDFSILSPEEYRTAALTATRDLLAAVVAEVPFDPPRPWVEAADVISALDAYRPVTHARIPPPEIEELEFEDPLDLLERAAAQEGRWLDTLANELLGVDTSAPVSPPAAGVPWDRFASELSRLFRLDSRPELGYRLDFSDALQVLPEGDVTYASPADLRRVDARTFVALEVIDGGVRGG